MSHEASPTGGARQLRAWALGAALLLGLILIGVPVVHRARVRNHRQANVDAMMQVLAAKRAYAVDYELSKGAEVGLEQLIAHSEFLTAPPYMPEGELTIGPIGTYPTVEFRGETLSPLAERRRMSARQTRTNIAVSNFEEREVEDEAEADAAQVDSAPGGE